MDQQDRIDRMERGRIATISSGFLLEPIQEARNNIIQRLVNLYRAGETSHDTILGGIAEIAALDGLMHAMEVEIRQGNVAAAKEYGNG